jgi:hypothetical protein
MLLATLLLLAGAPQPSTPPESDRAACLKDCAGAPKDATGQKLLACLNRCEPAADAGIPAR